MKLEYLGGGRWMVLETWPMKGFITDLASIPRILTPLFPVNSDILIPAIWHDYGYSAQDEWNEHNTSPRKSVDDFFYRHLRAFDVPWWRAKMMYWGVRLFGGKHWKSK